KVFTKTILIELEKIFSNVCQKFEAELVEFNGEYDHVHLLVNYPPKISVSKLVNSLKGVCSRMLRKKTFPQLRNLCVRECTLVSKLFCCILWRRSFRNHTTLYQKPSIAQVEDLPYIPDLKDGVLRH
ncbi:MAG: IS200/IS605 family transposase, partial [Rhabdochlamydiaceae bacterium]|nr:IS200/IS605 family transposase [Candidatus Amphrikana amoebophyrae]